MQRSVAIGATLVGVLGLVRCATTSVEASWKDPTFEGPVHNVLVVGLSSSSTMQRAFESELVGGLQASGVKATALSAVVPETLEGTLTGDEMGERIREAVETGSFDAVLVSQVVGTTPDVDYVPGAAFGTGLYGWYGAAYPSVWAAGHLDETVTWRIETRLFETRGDANLVWSMTSETFDPPSAEATVKEVEHVVVRELAAAALLPAPPAPGL